MEQVETRLRADEKVFSSDLHKHSSVTPTESSWRIYTFKNNSCQN